MHPSKYLLHTLSAVTAAVVVSARLVPGTDQPGPILAAAASFVTGEVNAGEVPSLVETRTSAAVRAFAKTVRPLSHPKALETAFRGYFAFKAANPDDVKKPFLYFVDFGRPSTEPRGYVFDMEEMRIVEGPFTVAHGRGSSSSQYGVPTRFSNKPGSEATSLGLYLARETYTFRGKTAGRAYQSVGLRLQGLSRSYNDKAFVRRVVAHGAPYVTPDKAGRSEGCPAMEQQRARRLLPKLADGGVVFLFAPDAKWMAGDPWITGE